MRTATINIGGKDRLLCFSARVVRSCTERYGGVEHIGEHLSGQDVRKNLDEAVWLLGQMLDAGARYSKMSGLDNPDAPSVEELYDLLGMDDFADLRGKISETISNGGTASVKAVAPKNAGATPEEV